MVEKEEEQKIPMFNGSIDTLQRINFLLVDCQKYRVNNNPIGHRANLFEVYKECYGFLTQKEITKAQELRQKIISFKVGKDEETGEILFEPEIFEYLDELDIYLRSLLVKHRVTFSTFAANDRMAELYKQYGISKDN